MAFYPIQRTQARPGAGVFALIDGQPLARRQSFEINGILYPLQLPPSGKKRDFRGVNPSESKYAPAQVVPTARRGHRGLLAPNPRHGPAAPAPAYQKTRLYDRVKACLSGAGR